ncbi:8955_t:CDS:2 [Paraglomus brasilianum]|uniref:8955_t:CDS:1 n=1 Tax=Paraglomus brasilianum TaxID=144538 RepID=A0A9N9ARA0_9GLOM|nr:8955_t:CDS:2 [Paraglomus brasilianum]
MKTNEHHLGRGRQKSEEQTPQLGYITYPSSINSNIDTADRLRKPSSTILIGDQLYSNALYPMSSQSEATSGPINGPQRHKPGSPDFSDDKDLMTIDPTMTQASKIIQQALESQSSNNLIELIELMMPPGRGAYDQSYPIF